MAKKTKDMTSGALMPQIIAFSIPLALTGLLQLVYNAADMMVVGRYAGSRSLAAVGATAMLVNLTVNLFIGLATGSGVVVARNIGAGDGQSVHRAVHTTMLLSIVSGIVVMGIGIGLSPTFLRWMSTPDDIIDLSVLYLKIYFSGAPANMIYNYGAAILRANGDSKRPFIFLTSAGLINIALNLVFVIRFNLDVAGVAYATIISQYISAVCVVAALAGSSGIIRLSFRKLRFYKKELGEIIRIGLPAGIQSVFFNISNVLIQSSVNSLGATVMAGNAAAISVEGFYNTAYSSITSAAITFTSANVGAGKYSRLDRVRRCSLLASVCICGAFSVIYLLFGRYFLKLYTTEKEVVEWGMVRLTIFACTYFLGSFMDIMSAVLRGLGKSILPMFVSLGGAVGFRLFWIYAVFAQHPSYTVLLIGYPISWFLTFLIHFLVLMHVRKSLPGEDLPERKDP